jgi:hypothetical protein
MKEMDGEWIILAGDRVLWPDLVNTATELWVL